MGNLWSWVTGRDIQLPDDRESVDTRPLTEAADQTDVGGHGKIPSSLQAGIL